jgi:hypothetical protein
MKNLILALGLLMFASVSVNAQACSKSAKKSCAATCAKKEAKTADASTKVASAMSEADLAAETNENIEVRECAVSGAKSYYEKSVCEKSGSVSWNQVEYNTEDKAFSRVASASDENEIMEVRDGDVKAVSDVKKACCSKGDDKKACCSAKEKAACSKDGDKKACCSSKKKADSSK